MLNHADNAADSTQIIQAGAAPSTREEELGGIPRQRVRRPKSSFGNGLRPEGDGFPVSP